MVVRTFAGVTKTQMKEMRPYIISHMMMSIDGRIDCPMVAQISGEEYYTALDSFGISSKLSGRVTAALECSAVQEERANSTGAVLGKEAVHKAVDSEEYTIVVDTNGRLQMASGEADGHPLLVIMSERVTSAHLESLSQNHVSWIATGKERINLQRAAEILRETFGVERLIIVGGGNINGGFLEAGLIDEVSVMMAPGIDGRKGETAVFDGCTWKETAPYHLKLQSVEQVPGTEVIWARYHCEPLA